MSRLSTTRLVLLLQVAAAAVLGALAAVAATGLTRSFTYPLLVNAIVVTVTALCVVGVAILTSDPVEAPQTRYPPFQVAAPLPTPSPGPPPEGSFPAPIASGFPPPQTGFPGATPGALPPPRAGGHPLPADSGRETPTVGLSWHEAAARGAAGTAAAAAETSPPAPAPARPEPGPSGSAHLEIPVGAPGNGASEVRQIVQCPRCGGFEVQMHRARQGCAFECGGCGHPWHWRLGAPWPVTVVRPKLAHPRPGGPDPGGPIRLADE